MSYSIKLLDLLSELEVRAGAKFVDRNWSIKTEEEVREFENLIGLEITGDLYLVTHKLKKLPKVHLIVGGNLDLSDTKITSLPNNFKVGGGLHLYNTSITSLPNNLEVGGGLNLHGTPIKSLPDNLKVEGNLAFSGTEITSLPNNLEVGGDLNLRGTPLAERFTTTQIRRMIVRQGGNIGGDIYK